MRDVVDNDRNTVDRYHQYTNGRSLSGKSVEDS